MNKYNEIAKWVGLIGIGGILTIGGTFFLVKKYVPTPSEPVSTTSTAAPASKEHDINVKPAVEYIEYVDSIDDLPQGETVYTPPSGSRATPLPSPMVIEEDASEDMPVFRDKYNITKVDSAQGYTLDANNKLVINDIPSYDGVLAEVISTCNPKIIGYYYLTGGTFKMADLYASEGIYGRYTCKQMGDTVILEQCIELDEDKEKAKEAILHEIGHFLDKYNANDQSSSSSESELWLQITENEFGASGLDEYFKDPAEFFAESYKQYKTNPEFSSKCPTAYSYMDVLETQLTH